MNIFVVLKGYFGFSLGKRLEYSAIKIVKIWELEYCGSSLGKK